MVDELILCRSAQNASVLHNKSGYDNKMTPSTIVWLCSLFFDKWTSTNGSFLYFVDPTTQRYKYFAWAAVKHKQSSKTEIENLKLEIFPIDQPVKEAAKILLTLRKEEGCDKNCRLNMEGTGAHTNEKFKLFQRRLSKGITLGQS
uniref:Proteasome subunit alpha type-3 (inferred by orthology to a human protein) n=1 Tax=Strongyloides venezuelensis TaxID=75913 RepID=A0A0K0G4C5_STRVS